jgi:hypothetical protein
MHVRNAEVSIGLAFIISTTPKKWAKSAKQHKAEMVQEWKTNLRIGVARLTKEMMAHQIHGSTALIICKLTRQTVELPIV